MIDNTEDIDKLQKAILANLCMKTKGSKGAHLPEPYFMNKPQFQGRKGSRALRELVALGYIKVHPTGGETTYELDERGFKVCRELQEQRRKAL